MTHIQLKINELLSYNPYDLDYNKKNKLLLEICREQINYHIKNCKKYKSWYYTNNFKPASQINELSEVPFLPSSVFKLTNLKSLNKSKTIQSSGTSSSAKSTIFIDKNTSMNQTKSLSKILSYLLENKKKHYFIVDLEPEIGKVTQTMTARQAGMSGYLMGAKKKTYLLKYDERNNIVINDESLHQFKAATKEEPIVIIGYTYILYEYFLNSEKIDILKSKYNFHNDTKLIHFGGWKKLQNKSISKKSLLEKISCTLNIKKQNVYDIYGFTEQLGTIYASSAENGCRVSSYSNVIIRDTKTLEVLKDGETGFLQFISPLPLSYPGFSILNDDLGQITSRMIDKNNNEVVEFSVNPRLDNAEERGCGDTLPDNYYI